MKINKPDKVELCVMMCLIATIGFIQTPIQVTAYLLAIIGTTGIIMNMIKDYPIIEEKTK